MKNHNKKGFTIVELVIVIAVIAILAAVLIPTFAGLVNKANESADVQAVRQMNTFLAVEVATSEINSVLDVYEIFDESGFDVENYKPLHKDRIFYYDKQYKQILYVENATGKVIFPEEHKDETQNGHDWFSLCMEIETTPITPDTSVENVQSYTVTTAGEYAYVVEKLNKSFPANTEVVINLDADIDFKGANVTVASVPNGSTFTVNGNGKVIKNITANTYLSTGVGADANRKYTAAGLIGKLEGSASITNVTFENVNVKDLDTGNAALLIGSATTGEATLIIDGVTIKDSTVVGHRSVGALVGMLYVPADVKNVTLDTVNVQTVAGRSGLVFGFATMGGCNYTLTNITKTNSNLSIYECEQNNGTDCAIVDYTPNETYGTNATKRITSYSVETNGNKEYRTYGFNENAICCFANLVVDNVNGHADQYCTFKLFN